MSRALDNTQDSIQDRCLDALLAFVDMPTRAAFNERASAEMRQMRPKERPLMLFCHRLVMRLLRSGDFITVTKTEDGTQKLDKPLPPIFRAGARFLERVIDEHDRAFGERYIRVVDADVGHWSLVAPLTRWNAPNLALLWGLYGLERAEAWLFEHIVRVVGIRRAGENTLAPGAPYLWLWGPTRVVTVQRLMVMTRIRRKVVAVESGESPLVEWYQRLLMAGDRHPQHWMQDQPLTPAFQADSYQAALRLCSAGLWAPLNPAVRGLHDILANIEALDRIPSDAHTRLLKSTWASVMALLRDAPADQRPSPSLLRDVASRLDALGLLDPAARTFEVLDELAPDTEAALFRNGYPEAVAAVVLALVRHDERAAFETYMRLIDGPVGMTMDEAWEGTRRRLAKV